MAFYLKAIHSDGAITISLDLELKEYENMSSAEELDFIEQELDNRFNKVFDGLVSNKPFTLYEVNDWNFDYDTEDLLDVQIIPLYIPLDKINLNMTDIYFKETMNERLRDYLFGLAVRGN